MENLFLSASSGLWRIKKFLRKILRRGKKSATIILHLGRRLIVVKTNLWKFLNNYRKKKTGRVRFNLCRRRRRCCCRRCRCCCRRHHHRSLSCRVEMEISPHFNQESQTLCELCRARAMEPMKNQLGVELKNLVIFSSSCFQK